jgi:hypothetical protein
LIIRWLAAFDKYIAQRDPAVLKKVSVSLPFGIGSAEWEADSTQHNAAWSLYVELVTRVAVQSIGADQGTVREAMISLYSLFSSTCEILKAAGPSVGASHDSVGGIAIAVLNNGLCPFLSKSKGVLAKLAELGSALKLDFVGTKPLQNQVFRRVLKHALVIGRISFR